MASFDENGKYIKTNWKAGDKITATKLNKIEESIEAVNDNDISRHVEADARLDALEAKDVAHDKELTSIKNTIADNKAAAELGDYEINSRMQFLEEELNEGIEEVHNVASTVDGKIAQAEADMAAMVAEVESEMNEIQNDMTGYLPLSGGTITGDLSANCFESIKTVESADGGGTIGSTTKTQIFTDQYGQGRFLIGNNSTDTPLVFIANPHDRSYSVNGDFTPAGGTSLKLGSDMNRWSGLYCNAVNFGDKKAISDNNGILYITASNMEFFFQNDSDSAFPCFRPQENNIHLGHTSHRWNTLYLVNNPNVSSDRVMKENIEYIGKSKSELTYEDMYDFIKDDLGLATYNFIGDDKLRMNFIAQDLLVNADGTDSKVGQMIVNPVPVPTEEEIAEGKPYPTLSYDMGMYISVLAGALKESINKIEQLEARINELENK